MSAEFKPTDIKVGSFSVGPNLFDKLLSKIKLIKEILISKPKMAAIFSTFIFVFFAGTSYAFFSSTLHKNKAVNTAQSAKTSAVSSAPVVSSNNSNPISNNKSPVASTQAPPSTSNKATVAASSAKTPNTATNSSTSSAVPSSTPSNTNSSSQPSSENTVQSPGCSYGGEIAPCIGSSSGASGWGTPTFDDEFYKDSGLNAKWTTGWFNSTSASGPVNSAENDCYTPSQVSIGSSGLDLSFIEKSETCNSKTEPYDTGIITTDPYGGSGGFEYTYGFAEAFIYIPPSASGIANWPAFWSVTPAGAATYGEQDIVEGLGGQACYHYHTPSTAPGACATGNYSGWHTFGANWQNGSVTYYYDGTDVGTITNSGITNTPEYLILDNADGSYGGTTVAPTDMLVKYVRVWQ